MSGTPIPADRPAPADDSALMAAHGITRTAVHHFFVDGYRYTKLADALAQAKRRPAKGETRHDTP
jgi:hypothetical protein